MFTTMTKRLDAAHRAEQAARMSATGATWQQVADALGYRSRQAASQAVKRMRDRTPPETVEQARAKHDAALQLLQSQDFTRYLHAMQRGDDDTALRYSKELRGIVAERAKLAGAHAPIRTEVDVTVTHDPAAILAEAERQLLAALADRPQLPAHPTIDAEIIEP